MNRFKKIILSATIFILTICSTSIVFGSNQVSWNDFKSYMLNSFRIDLSTYETAGFTNENYFNTFVNNFNNATGFCIIENNNDGYYTTDSNPSYFYVSTTDDNTKIHLLLAYEEGPLGSNILMVEGKKANNKENYIFSNGNQNNTKILDYKFDSQTKKFVKLNNYPNNYSLTLAQAVGYNQNQKIFRWEMSDSESTNIFYSEENSKDILKDAVLCASNISFIVKDMHTGSATWAYTYTVPQFLETPFVPRVPDEPDNPNNPGTGGDIIYDYTNTPKAAYFKPYLIMNKKGLLNIEDNNEFILKVYSGDGTVDEANITGGKLNLLVFKASYSGDTNIVDHFEYEKTITKSAESYNSWSNSSNTPNEVRYTYLLNDIFENEFRTTKEYLYAISYQDFWGDTTSTIGYFYFNSGNALNHYTKSEMESIPFGFGGPGYNNTGGFNNNGSSFEFGGGGYRDENGNQIIETTDFSSVLNSSKSFLSNFLEFFNIFPAWLNTLIALAITVAIICRIIGR